MWDIGAGSGSIGIEWMRAANGAKAICFERNKNRQEMIAKNAFALGVPDLKIIKGEALKKLKDQPAPNAIFIGGDVANKKLFKACLKSLKKDGRLVVNAVTLEGEKTLYKYHKKLGGELVRLEISKVKKIGKYSIMQPNKAVTQYLYIKRSK
jgi:precorrin-6Y C5,15-methyltransferase (decarboxylating)